jgi:hypothetical protein
MDQVPRNDIRKGGFFLQLGDLQRFAKGKKKRSEGRVEE